MLAAEDEPWPLAAMGFLTLGRRFINNIHDIIDDRIDVVSRGLLGLTVACARCHDHKYDPIPTADYYSLYGVFAASSDEPGVPAAGRGNRRNTPGYQEFMAEAAAKREETPNDFAMAEYRDLLSDRRARVTAITWCRVVVDPEAGHASGTSAASCRCNAE